jgi:hypothetical protein
MNVRRSFVRIAALTVVTAMPLLGMAGVASAKAHHHHTGAGKGGPPANIIVTVQPNGPNNPLFEVGQSEVYAVVQVETLPNFADDQVTISSQQLASSCSKVLFDSFASGSDNLQANSITVYLDNEGNATVILAGKECAPGTDLVEADLAVAPYYTATTVVTVNPPTVTPPGVFGEPQTNGTAEEVETGDTAYSGDSDIYAVFFVEENPVYAEQKVEIGSVQLEDRCQTGWEWYPSNKGVAPTSNYSGPVSKGSSTPPSTSLDDDGNAAFVFKGTSCAAGTSVVVADVLAGTHDTFTTTFTVEPPAPTI